MRHPELILRKQETRRASPALLCIICSACSCVKSDMKEVSTDMGRPVRRLFTEVQDKGDGYMDGSYGIKGLEKKGGVLGILKKCNEIWTNEGCS